MEKTDPTKIQIQTNVKADRDPTILIEKGIARHGYTPFECTFISQIEGNLWQGGCNEDELHLHLPKFFRSLVSLYPWERYKVDRGQLQNEVYITMYDSEDQSFEQVEHLAYLVNEFCKQGPTLVHCQAGLNRSSLVAARAMMLQGKTADEAINLLRTRRSPACLCNPSFEAYLRGLDGKA